MTEDKTTQGFRGDIAASEAAPEAASWKGDAPGPAGRGGPDSGSTPGPHAGAGTVDDPGDRSLQDHMRRVQAGVDKLLDRFDEKLLHDDARTNEIKRLNAELAKHQPDARWNAARPFVDQMVRHLDEIRRFVDRYERRGDATAKDFVEALEWLHENIELALEEHGIAAYRPQAGRDPFDGRRHSVVGKPIPTGDPALSRVIERCIRPGFEREGHIVSRAAVRIYRHDEEWGPQEANAALDRLGEPRARS